MYDRVLLASYGHYSDAQALVDRLSDARFPVEETSIIGRDLRMVEDVTGRLSYGRAALRGAAGGAWFGFLVGLFLAIFAADATSGIAVLLWGLLFGALAGAAYAVVAYAMTGGRRDFVSTSQLVADRYDVVVDARTADDARRILGMTPRGPGTPAPAPPPDAPTGSTPAPAPTDAGRPSLRDRLTDRIPHRATR
jgi:hypothetical protein